VGIATGLAVYFVIWWIALFAVLPFWTRPRDAAREEGGWRGAPERPHLLRKALVTSLVAAVIWLALHVGIEQGWVSFRGDH
jgi:predicted secreted protein